MAKRVLSVLVVDDSAVVRQAATAILSQDPGMVVTVAADPYIALDKMGRSRRRDPAGPRDAADGRADLPQEDHDRGPDPGRGVFGPRGARHGHGDPCPRGRRR